MSHLDDIKELPAALRITIREELRNWGTLIKGSWQVLIVIFILLFVLLWIIRPAPPKVVEMAAGRPSDYTYALAQEYVAYFKKNGIHLQLISTDGTFDNLHRVRDPGDNIKIAFVQSGIPAASDGEQRIVSLGSVDYEPIWLFYWGIETDDQKLAMTHLLEEPISIGNMGSGTRLRAMQLLEINGLGLLPNMQELPEDEAIQALKKGDIRAMLLVEHYESPIVQDLLNQKYLVVASFVRAEAYAKQLKFIELLRVPRAAFNISRDYPKQEISLLSTTTNLVVDEDLHPAIQMLLMQASSEIVGKETFFSKSGEFPAIKDPTVPVSLVAQRFFDKGPPILHYVLPFWLAEFIERIIILALPFFAVVYPIIKSIPNFLEKRAKKKIFRFYAPLRQLENEFINDENLECIQKHLDALTKIETDLLKLRVHKKVISDFYALRSDIDFVRTILQRLQPDSGTYEKEVDKGVGRREPSLSEE